LQAFEHLRLVGQVSKELIMVVSTPRLYRITPTLESLQKLERLELSKPPKFSIHNRGQVASALEETKPEKWALDDVWTLLPDAAIPAVNVVAKGDAFAFDYFLCGFDFISKDLWEILRPFAATARLLDVHISGSDQAFIAKNFGLPVFPSLSPFEQIFIDAYWVNPDMPELRVREGFRPAAAIFNVATSPWLMCLEEVVEAVMPRSISGLEFVNTETGVRLIPGS
jgi:hypothetical protein